MIENDFNAVIESEVKGSATEFPIPVTVTFSQAVQSISQANIEVPDWICVDNRS